MTALYEAIQRCRRFAHRFSEIKEYYQSLKEENKELFNSTLYNEGPKSALKCACC